MEGYGPGDFRADLGAGLTVGVMLVPQGMAYALIAGLPPVYGLYAALVPLFIYALLGSSRQLAVGPVAIVSLLVAAGIQPLAQGDLDRAVSLALLLALMVGVLQVGMGLLRFGFLTRFLSHPVLAGFTSAAAIVIGSSQLHHLLGYPLPSTHQVHQILWAALTGLRGLHVPTVLLGVGGILALVGLRRWPRARVLPGALVVVVVGTLLVMGLGLAERGVAVVGTVPGGLPVPGLPLGPDGVLSWGIVQALLPVALTIALVGFMESLAVAKVYAARHRYGLDGNRELLALGMANLVGAFFRAFPTTGGFSRTAVNDQAGARSTVASLLSAALVGLTLLFLTGLFRDLPKAVLAAIVLVAVAGLVNWREALHLWRTDRRDLALMALTFVATLGLGIEQGILVGVLASLGILGVAWVRERAGVRMVLEDAGVGVGAEPGAGVLYLRARGPLSFATADSVRERLLVEAVSRPDLHEIVLQVDGVAGVDSTALHTLEAAQQDLEAQQVALFFETGAEGAVSRKLAAAGFVVRPS